MRPDRARALLSARRSRGRRRHQGTGREILIRAARQSRPGGVRRYAGSRGVRDRGTGRDGKAVSAAARAEPAVSVAGAGEGFDEGVRADAAGAWARAFISRANCATLIAQRSEAIHGIQPKAGLLRFARNDGWEPRNHSPRYAFLTSGLPRMSAALPCISTRPVCRM